LLQISCPKVGSAEADKQIKKKIEMIVLVDFKMERYVLNNQIETKLTSIERK
jgi:hypothetical protein